MRRLPIKRLRHHGAARRTGSCGRTPQKATAMILLTRLNSNPLVVNSDLIKLIENAPDTVLTLVTGEKIVVRESSEEILAKIVEFRQRILSGLTIQPLGSTISCADATNEARLSDQED